MNMSLGSPLSGKETNLIHSMFRITLVLKIRLFDPRVYSTLKYVAFKSPFIIYDTQPKFYFPNFAEQ